MKQSMGERLQSLPKPIIYLILILCTSIPLFVEIEVPNEPVESTIDYYAQLMALPEGSTVLLMSDWTGSTRGESKGAFRSTMKVLMRKNAKVAIFSTADPQAPRVAQDAINELNEERKRKNLPTFNRWENWVNLGYFPDAEAAINGLANDLKGAFNGRKDFPPNSPPRDVFQSPVLQGKRRVEDFPLMLVITASKTSNFTVERVSGRAPLAFAVTGVMVPETQVFYQSKQITGFCGGLKGVYDLEQLMESGINFPDKASAKIKSDKHDTVEGFPDPSNKGQGTRYYPTLHVALALMIIMVIIGNVGMILVKREAGK
jgi:hypothetical protein